ncbi:MAG: AAA family ATPase, partial [Candidatus Paceibacterota bacterium]
MWNNDENDVQTELFNNFFNDPELNFQRQEANRQAKYFDTQARHRSEDIRVINKVLEKVINEEETSDLDKIRNKIEIFKDTKNKLTDRLDKIQQKRSKVDHKLKLANNKVNDLSIQVSEVEAIKRKVELEKLESTWATLHKNYHLFTNNISTNEICPMCNQDLDAEFIKDKLKTDHNCILCNQSIRDKDEKASNDKYEDPDLESMHNAIKKHQNSIYEFESELKELDQEFNKTKREIRTVNTKIRNSEFELLKNQEGEDGPKNNLQAFYDEIDELENLKEEFQEKSKRQREIADKISNKIEEEIKRNTQKFSQIFSSFAEKFLGVKCSLTFDTINGVKRFYPVIDETIRETAEELSESQRFFVDHSFRMSILSFFYNNPSFYIAETPDSSLDISYERNAADVFMKFLETPYCLILTTNL